MKSIALPLEKRRYLLHVYLTQGFTAAKPVAIQYGIKPKTISTYARAAGHKGKRGREIGKWKRIRNFKSPLWKRAVEIGAVTA